MRGYLVTEATFLRRQMRDGMAAVYGRGDGVSGSSDGGATEEGGGGGGGPAGKAEFPYISEDVMLF